MNDLLPWAAKCVDDLAVIHSMDTDAIHHEPAILLMNTCNMPAGRSALGAWVSHSLGSINVQSVTPKLWSSGFLPTEHAAHRHRPVLKLRDPGRMEDRTNLHYLRNRFR